jgi:energy-converting hydrogenase Eha subunit H
LKFIEENGIKLLHYGINGNKVWVENIIIFCVGLSKKKKKNCILKCIHYIKKEPFVDMPEDVIRKALALVLGLCQGGIFLFCRKKIHFFSKEFQ